MSEIQEADQHAVMNKLREYQKDGVSFLLNSQAALLADQMGLGKTVQTAVAVQLALEIGTVRRVLVVAPYSLVLNWQIEIQHWAPSVAVQLVRGDSLDRFAYYRLPIPVLIASYEQIRSDAPYMTSDMLFDLVILDEAQRIKNPDSLASLACRLLSRKRAWALTGTPIENSVRDLVAVFAFLSPGLIRLGMTRNELQSRMRQCFLRRTKRDVLPELPPIISQTLELELSGAQADSYTNLWESRFDLLDHKDDVTEVHLLSLITKLKQLCNFDRESGQSVKLDALRTILDSNRDAAENTIVFSQFVETLQWLRLQLEDDTCDLLHGAMSGEERQRVVSEFQEGTAPRVLLVSLKAGGVGLNLQSASTVVLFDRWWNPAVENQAIERAHRFGRQRVLQVVKFLVRNTIEDRIEAILKDKQQLFDQVIESTESAVVNRFTRAELSNVLELGGAL